MAPKSVRAQTADGTLGWSPQESWEAATHQVSVAHTATTSTDKSSDRNPYSGGADVFQTRQQSVDSGGGSLGGSSGGGNKSASSKGSGSRRTARKANDMRLVAASSVCGTAVLSLTMIAIVVVWILNINSSTTAVNSVAELFRKKQAETASQEIAMILHQMYESTTAFADNMIHGGVQREYITVLPPSPETFSNFTHLGHFHREIYPTVDKNILMTKSWDDVTLREYHQFAASTFVLALKEDGTPAINYDECVKVVYSEQRFYATETVHHVERQYFNDAGGMTRNLYEFDVDTYEIGDILEDNMHILTCHDLMEPLWDHETLPTFNNFTWYVQEDLEGIGLGDLFGGTVPIYDDHHDTIGRAGFALALGWEMEHLLDVVMHDGEEMTADGFSAFYTVEGRMRGVSEPDISTVGGQPHYLYELETGSRTYKSMMSIEAKHGTICPETQDLFETDDDEPFLIDISPFDSYSLGVPPFEERWCLMTTVPRDNMYSSVDEVLFTTIFVAIISGICFIVAVSLLGISLMLVIQAQRRLRHEQRAAEISRVIEAEQNAKLLAAPMVLVSATEFLKMRQFEGHEVWRNRGKLLILDTMEDIRLFQRKNYLVFISHQWLAFNSPDSAEARSLAAMQNAVRITQADVEFPVYVWVDYLCVSQRHPNAKKMAVSALPAYISLMDRFIIVAPDAIHKETGLQCNLSTYGERGWCRMELMAKVCSTGFDRIFVCTGVGSDISHMMKDHFEHFSFNVYEGEFTVAADKEMLVQTILGIYSLLLKRACHTDSQQIVEEIDRDRDAFFPQRYSIEEAGLGTRKRKLFGELVRHMERYVVALERMEGRNSATSLDGSENSFSSSLSAGVLRMPKEAEIGNCITVDHVDGIAKIKVDGKTVDEMSGTDVSF